MIKTLLITDNHGTPFYSRSANNFEELNENLFSGLICSIGQIGKRLFQQKLATIHFGESDANSQLVIISKDFYSDNRLIYFAFFIEEKCNNMLLKEITAQIFIVTKPILKNQKEEDIKQKIDEILQKKYSSLAFCE